MSDKSKESMIVDPKFFSTPDMGEYMSSRMLTNILKDNKDDTGEKALFFVEEPFTTVPGYYKSENVFVISGTPSFSRGDSKYNRSMSNFDGDTIHLDFNEVIDGGIPFKVDGKEHYSIKDYIYKTCEMDTTKDQVKIRLLGINTPEVPKFRTIYFNSREEKAKVMSNTIKISIDELKKNNYIRYNGKRIPTSNFSYCAYDLNVSSLMYDVDKSSERSNGSGDIAFGRMRPDNIKLTFMPSKDVDDRGEGIIKMFEIMPDDYFGESNKNHKSLVTCASHIITKGVNAEAYCKQGEAIVNQVRKEIIAAGKDIVYILDNNTLKTKKGILPYEYRKSYEKIAENPFRFFEEMFKWLTKNGGSAPNLGFRYFGQEFNGRCLGAVYYKMDVEGKKVWVNLAKRLIYNYNMTVPMPDYGDSPHENANLGYASDAFKLWTYDPKNIRYIDSLYNNQEYHDDRETIQKKISPYFNKELVNDHTVVLGDCLFHIPPTSIRTVNQTECQRVSLLRAKGSMTKASPITERIIEMDIYFNKSDGINGTPVEYELPNGDTVKYYMNGLRSLIAQFKFAPFLPIENEYINNTLNIEAVALMSYSVSTMPNYPRTVRCTITMTEFNYLQIMPELSPVDIVTTKGLFQNLFSKTIHWPLLRYYYQRAIWQGEILSDIEYNSEEYIEKTLGQKTALVKADFKDPLISFYIANENNLKQRLQLKKELEMKPLESKIKFEKSEREFIFNLAKIYGVVLKAMSQKSVQDDLKKLNDKVLELRKLALEDNATQKLGFWTSSHDGPIDENDGFKISILYKDHKTGSWLTGKPGGNPNDQNNAAMISEFWNNYICTLVRTMQKEIKTFSANNSEVSIMIKNIGRWFKYSDKGSIPVVGIGNKIEINWEAYGTTGTKNKIKKFLSKKLGVAESEILKDDAICILNTAELGDNIVASWKEIISPFGFNRASDFNDVSILSAFANLFGMRFDKDGNLENANEINVDKFFDEMEMIGQMKDGLDIESAKTLIFDEYFIGYPVVTGMNFAYNNVFNNISLKSQDGYAAQFTGGSDTIIDISLTTTDKFTVSKLELLPRICTSHVIDYRKIMTSSPLRIKCEMAQLMGINEVVIESLSTSTVEGQPGVYEINIRMVSVDRTLRNRESLKKVDDDNATNSLNVASKTKNYFDLKDTLKRADLYPDLELPTLYELNYAGFYFITDKLKSNTFYPDPDFYFVYTHLFTSDMIKDCISKFFSEEENFKQSMEIIDTLSDNFGTFNLNLDYKDNKIIDDVVTTGYEEDKKGNKKRVNLTSKRNEILKRAEENFKKRNITGGASTVEAYLEMEKDNFLQANAVNNLKEMIRFSRGSQAEINLSNRPNVSAMEPYGASANTMQEDENIKSYSRKEGFKTIEKTSDAIEIMQNSVKELIMDILSKPIPKNKGFGDSAANSIVLHKNYRDFFDYLLLQIAGSKEMDGAMALGQIYNYGKDTEEGKTIYKSSYGDYFIRLFEALASGASGEIGILHAELKDKHNQEWRGKAKVTIDNGVDIVKIPNVRYALPGQGISGIAYATTDKEREDGIIFGGFGIRKYTSSFLGSVYNIDFKIMNNGFLDPYYNHHIARIFLEQDISEDEAKKREKEYMECILDEDLKTGKAAHAIFRLMLLWLYKCIDTKNGFISNSIYSLRKVKKMMEEMQIEENGEFFNEIRDLFYIGGNKVKTWFWDDNTEKIAQEKIDILEEKRKIDDELEKILKEYKKTIDNDIHAMINGMFSMLGMMVLSERNPAYQAAITGNMSDLNQFILTHKDGYVDTTLIEGENQLMFSRYLQRLDHGIEGANGVGKTGSYVNPLERFSAGSIMNRVYMEAADKPSIYMLHSFYDMVINDKRGRMARAFPTFYLLLIDEGRHIGSWKLQDNFYDVSSIVEFQVVKSRKIAADTAIIQMTNIFGTYTLEDEDIKDEYEYTFKDVWDSLVNVRGYVSKEHERRKNARDINRANIIPGTRVHLRAGYGSDASELPTLFNGCVTEIEQGDIMGLICQGDGVELGNPNMFNASDSDDVSDLHNNGDLLKMFWDIFSSRSTPRELLLAPLLAKGKFVEEIIKDISKSRFFFANPFGITHFGDREFKKVFGIDGEVSQNIFEGSNKPVWRFGNGGSGTVAGESDLDTPPMIRVELQGNRSYWDIMHIAASVSPDYVCAITPFDLRSSIFHGHPRYYYAYTYFLNNEGQIQEKRKPFQQYHIFSSATDIIGNTITASAKDVRTNARGIYTGHGVLSEKVKAIGPLFLDINIYPEYQQSTTINCCFQYKASDVPFTVPIMDWIEDEFDEAGGYQIAWRATANGLRETVKDMYKGELIIMGYPSIKPYDRFYISDVYEEMEGMMDVQQVVHTMSSSTGFVTSITPDCISSITDDYDKIAISTAKKVLQPFVGSLLVSFALTSSFTKVTRAAYLSLGQGLKNGAKFMDKAYASTANVMGKEKILELSKYVDDETLSKLGFAAGLSPMDYKLQSALTETLSKLDKIPKSIDVKDLKRKSDIIGALDDIAKAGNIDEMTNVDDLYKAVEDAMFETKNPETLKKLEEHLEYLELMKQQNSAVGPIKDAASIGKDELSSLVNKISAVDDDDAKAVAKALKTKFPDGIKSGADYDEGMKMLKKGMGFVDNIDDDIVKIVHKISARSVNKVADAVDAATDARRALKGLKLVTIGKGVKALLASSLPTLILTGATMLGSKLITDYFEKRIVNYNVLTVFPVFKNSKAYTAGMLGNQGSVFGSHTYEQEGHFQKMIKWFFDDTESGFPTPLGIARDMLMDTSTIKEMLGVTQKNLQSSDTMANETNPVIIQKNLLKSLISQNASPAYAYNKLLLSNRVSFDNKAEVSLLSVVNSFNDINNIEENRKIMDNLDYIFGGEFAELLHKEGVLRFSAEGTIKGDSAVTAGTEMLQTTYKIGATDVKYPAKVIQREGKLPIYDIPYLRPDAIIVLFKIIEKIAKKLGVNPKEIHKDYTEMKKHPIIIHNATRINDSSYYNTGYAFSIEVKNSDILGNILKEMKLTDSNESELFRYRKCEKILINTWEVFLTSRS